MFSGIVTKTGQFHLKPVSRLLISVQKCFQGEIYMQMMPLYWFLIAETRIIEVMIPLECKNDTNTPAVLEVWVLEFGPGLGQM